MKKKINYLFIFAAVALLFGATACKGGKEEEETKGTTVSETDPVMSELTETAIGGTEISATATVAGLVKNLKTGQPIAGINVTDGYSWVKTDANGVYQMTFNQRARKIYITTPSEYKIGLDKYGYPNFYCKDNVSYGNKYRIDFTLEPLDAPETDFILLPIGDPQCSSTGEVARYATETIPKIKEDAIKSGRHVYAVTLGDIIFDSNITWYPMYVSMRNVVAGDWTIPFFQCMGNHDHDATLFSTSDDRLDMQWKSQTNFVKYFGPQDYSFDRGSVHVIVMDNVWVTGSSSSSKSNGKTCTYYSGLSAEQYQWLVQDIANVENPSEKMVVLCSHIPWRGGGTNSGANVNKDKYYSNVLGLLTKFHEAHIMIGHTHYSQNYIHSEKTQGGTPVYEHVHGAACGAWWACNSNVTGAPNGFGYYEISGNEVKNWQAMNSNFDDSFQLRVWNGDQEFTGSKGYKLKWSNATNTVNGLTAKGFANAAGAFVAEVWNDDVSNWKVEFWQNGQKVGNFTRLANGSCANIALASYWFNEKSKNSTSYTSTTASHYWYYKPTSGLPASETDWEVRFIRKIPTSGITHTYTRNTLTTDYSEF